MTSFSRALKKTILAALVVAHFVISSNTAKAQVAVIDNSVLMKAADTLKTVNSQLSQLTQMTGLLGKIQNAIGNPGLSSIGSLLGALNIGGLGGGGGGGIGGMGGCLGALSSLTNLSSGGGSFSSIMGAVKGISSGCLSQTNVSLTGLKPSLPGVGSFSGITSTNSQFSGLFSTLNSLFSNAGTSIGTNKTGVQQSLYLPSGGSVPNNQQIEALNAVRSTNLREAATNAMAAGIQGRATIDKTSASDIQTLSEQAKSAKDLRADIAVNNAIMLKVLAQLQQNNAQLSSMLHLNGAQVIANDAPSYTNSGSGN